MLTFVGQSVVPPFSTQAHLSTEHPIVLFQLPGLTPEVSEGSLSGLAAGLLFVLVLRRFASVVTFSVWYKARAASLLLGLLAVPAISVMVLGFVWLFIVAIAFALELTTNPSLLSTATAVLSKTETPALWAMYYFPALIEHGAAGVWYWHYLLTGYALWLLGEALLVPVTLLNVLAGRKKQSDILDKIQEKAARAVR